MKLLIPQRNLIRNRGKILQPASPTNTLEPMERSPVLTFDRHIFCWTTKEMKRINKYRCSNYDGRGSFCPIPKHGHKIHTIIIITTEKLRKFLVELGKDQWDIPKSAEANRHIEVRFDSRKHRKAFK